MRARVRLLVTTLTALASLSACNTSPAPPPPPAKPVVAPVSPAPAKPVAPSASGMAATSGPSGAGTEAGVGAITGTSASPGTQGRYEAKGRRDPFAPLDIVEGTKTATVAAAKLRGVIRSRTGPVALVDTADGVGYILRQGDTLADGRLVEIGQDSVVFAIVPRPGTAANRVTLTLPAE